MRFTFDGVAQSILDLLFFMRPRVLVIRSVEEEVSEATASTSPFHSRRNAVGASLGLLKEPKDRTSATTVLDDPGAPFRLSRRFKYPTIPIFLYQLEHRPIDLVSPRAGASASSRLAEAHHSQ